MPDEFDVPEWVSEPRASPSSVDERPVLRPDDARSNEREREQLRGERRRRHGAPGPSRAGGHPDHEMGAHSPADAHDSTWPTRAERRQRLDEATSRRQLGPRRTTGRVEMVSPALQAEHEPETPTRRRTTRPPKRKPRVTFARRRAAAALALTTSLALLLWSFWPSQDSSAPERGRADLTSAAAVTQQGNDPTPAAEDLPTATPTGPTTPASGAKRVPRSGTGKTLPVALPSIAAPNLNPNRTIRVGLRVESGAGIDAAQAATIISRTLGDERGWQTRDQVRFRAVSAADLAAGDVDITIVLASPDLTDDLCAPLRTRGEVSCFNLRKVVLNARRWTEGVPGYGTDVAAYRQYMVNHEIGHGLYHGHVECPGKGTPAPIMLQQSKGLDGCRPNAWPTVR